MRLSDRLIKDTMEKNRKKSRGFFNEDEETLTYKQRERSKFINEKNDTFKGLGDDSFHLAPSIFDQQAIFHTGKQEKR